MRAASYRALAQPPQAVALFVEGARRGCGLGRVEHPALLGGEQEDEPVDEAQQLLEERLRREVAGRLKSAARSALFSGCATKPCPSASSASSTPRRRLSRARVPCSAAGAAPGLQRALGRRLFCAAEAGLVQEQPEGGEVGVALLLEDAREVGLDPRGAREARVVAEEPQREAVARDAPEGLVGGVEKLLHETERAALRARPRRRAREGGVEARAPRGDHHRHARSPPRATRPMGKTRPSRSTGARRRARASAKPKTSPRSAVTKRSARAVAVGAARAPGLEVAPVGLGDAPVAPDLVAEVEPARNAVVGLGLLPRVELREAAQPLGREQPAFDGERLEGELRGSTAGLAGRSSRGTIHAGHEGVEADDVGRGGAPSRRRLAAGVGGLAHAAVVGEQRLRARRCAKASRSARASADQREGSAPPAALSRVGGDRPPAAGPAARGPPRPRRAPGPWSRPRRGPRPLRPAAWSRARRAAP